MSAASTALRRLRVVIIWLLGIVRWFICLQSLERFRLIKRAGVVTQISRNGRIKLGVLQRWKCTVNRCKTTEGGRLLGNSIKAGGDVRSNTLSNGLSVVVSVELLDRARFELVILVAASICDACACGGRPILGALWLVWVVHWLLLDRGRVVFMRWVQFNRQLA